MDKITSIAVKNDHTLHIFKLEVRDYHLMPSTIVRAAYQEFFVVHKYASKRDKPCAFYLAKRHDDIVTYDGWFKSGKPYGGQSHEFKDLLDRMIVDAWVYA